jgi:hypothetical protein
MELELPHLQHFEDLASSKTHANALYAHTRRYGEWTLLCKYGFVARRAAAFARNKPRTKGDNLERKFHNYLALAACFRFAQSEFTQ